MDDLNQQQQGSQEPVQPEHDVPLGQPQQPEVPQELQPTSEPQPVSPPAEEQPTPPLTVEDSGQPKPEKMEELLEEKPSIQSKKELKGASTGETIVEESKKSLLGVIIALVVLALIVGVVYLIVMYRGSFGLFGDGKPDVTRDVSVVEESTESLDELDSVFDKLNEDFEDLETEISEEAELETDLEL